MNEWTKEKIWIKIKLLSISQLLAMNCSLPIELYIYMYTHCPEKTFKSIVNKENKRIIK